MRAAYADPPYLGLAAKFYGDRHPNAADYDRPETHQRLIDRLSAEYDCWAMSLHSPALQVILPMCPPDVRAANRAGLLRGAHYVAARILRSEASGLLPLAF